MGLDMYLSGYKYLWRDDDTRQKVKKQLKSSYDPKYVVLELMYWRKANAIHKWFVDNVQEGEDDCKEHLVSIDDLKQLLSVVNSVLQDTSLAEQLLPPVGGFFFGSTAVDEWYWKDLENTRDRLNELLSSPDIEELDIYYQSSW
jgi:hypothetical protein